MSALAAGQMLNPSPLDWAIEVGSPVLAVALYVSIALRSLRGPSRRERREAAILAYLAERPEGAHGLDMFTDLRIGSGSLYPALARLEASGRVRSWWGQPDGDRPRRRLYGLAQHD